MSMDPHGHQSNRQQQFTKKIIGVSIIEAILLIGAIVLVYVFEVIPPDEGGIWLLLGAAVIGAMLMFAVIFSHQRQLGAQQGGSGTHVNGPGSSGGLSDSSSQPQGGYRAVPLDDAVAVQARSIRDQGHTIAAIKYVREQTGMGLKEAKDYVEAL